MYIIVYWQALLLFDDVIYIVFNNISVLILACIILINRFQFITYFNYAGNLLSFE